jgi:hypothetical protein
VTDPVPFSVPLSLSVQVSGVESDPKSVTDPVPLPLSLSLPVSGVEPDPKSVTDPVPLPLSLSIPVSGVEPDPKSVMDPVFLSVPLPLSPSLYLISSLILSQWQTLSLCLSLRPCPSIWC